MPLKKLCAEVQAGEPCSGPNQCVPQAHCTANVSGLCICDSDFYNEKGKCHERKSSVVVRIVYFQFFTIRISWK